MITVWGATIRRTESPSMARADSPHERRFHRCAMFGSQASGKWHLRQLLRSSPEPPFYAGEDTPEAGRADTPTPVTRGGTAPRQRSVEEVGFRGPLRLWCRWRDRRCPRRQAETFEDRPGGVGRMDRGEDSHGPVADRALQDIHGERPSFILHLISQVRRR